MRLVFITLNANQFINLKSELCFVLFCSFDKRDCNCYNKRLCKLHIKPNKVLLLIQFIFR